MPGPRAIRWVMPIGAVVLFALASEGLVRLIGPEIAIPGDEQRFRADQRNHRAVLYHERDDAFGWRLVRNQLVRAWVDDGTAPSAASPEPPPMRTNREGFRGRDFEITKRPGVTRILVAGDSNAMGFGVPRDERIYSSGVEQLLNRHLGPHGVEIEVVNLGIDGYSSHQTRLLLEHYAPLMEPDVVCVQVGFNDHWLAAIEDAAQVYRRPWILNALEQSHAYRWLRRQVLSASGANRQRRDPVARVAPEAYEKNIGAIADLCRDLGATLHLLTTPPNPDVPFVISEVPVMVGGERMWMTEREWFHRELENGGVSAPYPVDDPRCLPIVEAAIAKHPDWATLHFMRSKYLLARGDREAALKALRTSLSLDAERVRVRGYMDRLREVALTRPHVSLVDVEVALDRWAEANGVANVGELYFDFVHLAERGHVAIATELASQIGAQLVAR